MLSDEDARIIALERVWLHRRQHDGRKEAAIRSAGFDVTAYYQRLVGLLRVRGAWELDYQVMHAVRSRVARHRLQGRRPGGATGG